MEENGLLMIPSAHTHACSYQSPFYPFRAKQGDRPTRTGEKAVHSPDLSESPAERPLIRCRACGYGITDISNRIRVNGAYAHTFANPHGIVFEIGCFSQADGCIHPGNVNHLGWQYASAEGATFFGLILDHLLFPDAGGPR